MSSRRWALVTGASTGIGRALAFRFAEAGYGVALVSRDAGALEALALELKRFPGADALAVPIDLSKPESGRKIRDRLAKEGIRVEVLVNNAGFGVHGPYATTELSRELELVHLQVVTLLELTKLFLPGMIERRSGGILNVASVYSFAPVPNQAVYSASKAFMLNFSESLAGELRDSGVRVTTVCPGITMTEFRKRAGMKEKKTAWSMSADAVADAGFRGFQAGKRVVVPGGVNKAFVWIARHVPTGWVASLVRGINHLRGIGGGHKPALPEPRDGGSA